MDKVNRIRLGIQEKVNKVNKLEGGLVTSQLSHNSRATQPGSGADDIKTPIFLRKVNSMNELCSTS